MSPFARISFWVPIFDPPPIQGPRGATGPWNRRRSTSTTWLGGLMPDSRSFEQCRLRASSLESEDLRLFGISSSSFSDCRFFRLQVARLLAPGCYILLVSAGPAETKFQAMSDTPCKRIDTWRWVKTNGITTHFSRF